MGGMAGERIRERIYMLWVGTLVDRYYHCGWSLLLLNRRFFLHVFVVLLLLVVHLCPFQVRIIDQYHLITLEEASALVSPLS